MKFLSEILAKAGITSNYFKLDVATAPAIEVGKIVWNSADGTFDMGLLNDVTLQAGQELHFYGKAVGAIGNGQAVMFAGAQGDHALMSLADAATINANPEYFIGVATQDFANNDFGYVTVLGKVRGLDTSTYTAGDLLYYNSTSATDGLLTSTMPSAPNAKILVAAVLRSHATEGILLVRPHTMPKISDIQDVSISSVANNEVFVYESATSVWKNKSIATILGYTPANDSNVVKLTGNQTVGGEKTFSGLTTIGLALYIKSGSATGVFLNSYAANSLTFGVTSSGTTYYSQLLFPYSSQIYTLPSATGTLALTSDLSAYLPLTGGTLTGGLVINPANASVIGLDAASDTIRLRADSTNPFPRQLTTTLGSGTLVKIQAAGYGATYVTDLGFYTSSTSAVNTTPNLYLTGGDNRVGINTTTPGYTLDVDGTGRYTGALIANSFVKNGGTSLQFLMADGSVSLGATATARTEQIFTATSGQTTFTVTGGYVVGLVDVYINGVKLLPSDFTATNGSTVVLATGAVLNDSVTIINYTATIAALPTSRDTIDYTATSAQTTFTVSGGYVVGLLDVYVNGVKLTSSEYTATNGTTFVLTVASVTGDQVQAIRYNASVNGVSGSGIANYIPKFTASQTLGNSLIQDDGTTVTIGSTNSALMMPRAATSNDATINFSTGGTNRWQIGTKGVYGAEDLYIWNVASGYAPITFSAASSLANFGVSIRAITFTSYTASGIFLNNSSAGTSSVHMRLNNTGGDLRMGIESSAGGGFQTGTSAYAAVFGNQANYSTQFTTNGIVRLTIDNSGAATFSSSVAVGTNLTVGTATGGVSAPTNILMDSTYRTGGAAFDALKFYLYKSSTETYGIGLGDLADMQYWAGTTSTGVHRWFTSQTERMRITSGGQVGIGVTSVNGYAKFEVNGNIMSSGSSTILMLNNTGGTAQSWWIGQDTAGTNDGIFYIYNQTSNFQAINIRKNNNVLIGTTTDIGARLHSNGNIISSGSGGSNGLLSRENSTASTYGFFNAGNSSLVLTNSGVANVGYFAMSSGNYVATSDRNKKKDFEPSTLGLAEVLQLAPTLYRFKTEADDASKHLGFIAQDVKDVVPPAYKEELIGTETFIGLESTAFIPVLVKAIQELKAELDLLKNK